MPKTGESDKLPEKSRRSSSSFLSYHSRECSICRHPDRDLIDHDFLRWTNVDSMAAAYGIQRRAIYRHAHATNLFERRNRDLRFALGHIIEHAGSVPVTADAVVRAVRLYACLNDEGQWIGPAPHSPLVRSARHASAVRHDAEAVTGQSSGPPSTPDAADGNARSTHPNDQNTSQLIENKRSQPDQIDTNPTPSHSPEFRNNRSEAEQGTERSSDDGRLFQHAASSVQPLETQV